MAVLWGIAIGLAVYTIAATWLDRHGRLPEYLGVQGPILTLHTQRGKAFLDWLAGPRRFWRAWANIGVGIALVVMTGMFAFLIERAVFTLQQPPPVTAVNQPANVLVIPGVNEFLPLAVGHHIVAGLLIGLVVHEGGHGLQCRVEGIDIDSMGLAFISLVPVGAFVEPNEESQKAADRGGQTRMFAAGVMNNFAISAVMILLFFGPVVGSIAPAAGVGVAQSLDGSAADGAGIERGDRIVALGGQGVDNTSEFSNILAESGRTVSARLANGESVTVERSVMVAQAAEENPLGLDIGETIRAVNGTPVYTEAQLRSNLTTRPIVSIETDNGTTTGPVGVYVSSLVDGGPLSNASDLSGTDSSIVLTRVAGNRTVSYDDLGPALEQAEPGSEISVEVLVDGDRRTYDVVLGDDGTGNSYLGVRPVRGISGVGVTDFGIRSYPTQTMFALLGGEGDDGTDVIADRFGGLLDSWVGLSLVMIFLPVASLSGFPENFAGFYGPITNFYTVQGPLEPLGGGVFVLANLLFWSIWINVQLAFFNLIPAFPLDGGHILRTSTESILSRLPFDARRPHVRVVTVGFGLAMLASLLVMLFGPHLLR